MSDPYRAHAALESARDSADKDCQDLRAQLRELERSRLESSREAAELRRQLEQLQVQMRERLSQLSELQQRLSREQEAGDNCKRDLVTVRQQVRELVTTSMANSKSIK